MTFPNYVRLERGKGLPKGPRLERLVGLLGLSPAAPRARDLVRAYLAQLLGSEVLLEALTAPAPADAAPASWMLAENAARQAIGQRAVQLSLEQYRALARDGRAYAVHVLLCNTAEGLTRRELAAATGVSGRKLDQALRTLKKSELLDERSKRFKSPFVGKFVVPPAPVPALAAVYKALGNHRARWLAQGRAKLLESPYLLLRAPRRKIEQYLVHLGDVVRMSAIYGDVRKGSDSHVYLVEGRVYEFR